MPGNRPDSTRFPASRFAWDDTVSAQPGQRATGAVLMGAIVLRPIPGPLVY